MTFYTRGRKSTDIVRTVAGGLCVKPVSTIDEGLRRVGRLVFPSERTFWFHHSRSRCDSASSLCFRNGTALSCQGSKTLRPSKGPRRGGSAAK